MNSRSWRLREFLSVPFGVHIGREFVNGATTFLVAGVLSQGLRIENWRDLNALRNLCAFGLLIFVVTLVLSPCLSSPQPDVSAAAVAIAAAWYFFAAVNFSGGGDKLIANKLLLCVSASVAALELKLSYIAFGAARPDLGRSQHCSATSRAVPADPPLSALCAYHPGFPGFAADILRAGAHSFRRFLVA